MYKSVSLQSVLEMPKSDVKTTAPSTTADKCGLIIAPPRYRNKLVQGGYAQRYSTTLHVWTAAMMEVILTEILREGAERCAKEKHSTITRHHNWAAIQENPDLAQLFNKIDMHEVGVAEHVSPALVSKPKSRRKKSRSKSRK